MSAAPKSVGSDHAKLSRVAVFHGSGQPLTFETVMVPILREGEILVRVEYTTLCRSDLTTFMGKRREKTPTILGHEIVGVIEDFGPAAPVKDCRGAALRVGDRITWAIYAADPSSNMARRGIPQKAAGLFKYGHELISLDSTLHGGLAEYCILRQFTPVIRLAPEVPLPLAALINCAVATAAGALRMVESVKDRVVLITGAGMLGVVAGAMCRCAGARLVIAADIDAERLTTARKFGADYTFKMGVGELSLAEGVAALKLPESITVGLDFSGVPDTMEALMEALGVGGTAVLIGAISPQRSLQINAERVIRNLHTIKGLHNYNEQDFIAAVDFIERHHGDFPFASLVEDRFDLDSVNEAFAHGVNSGAYRVGIRMGGGDT